MEKEKKKLNPKIIIPVIAIVIVVVIGIVIMMYKYSDLKKELVEYKDIYSKLKEEKLTISGEDTISLLELKNEELNEEFIKLKEKYDKISEQLAKNQKKLEEYEKYVVNIENDYKTSSGEGIILTLKDNNNSHLYGEDLLIIVNELKDNGAEAISINGQRIVNSTSITSVENTVLVNKQRITSPFVIKATGSKDLLKNNEYLEQLKNDGISVEYEKLDVVTIEEYK